MDRKGLTAKTRRNTKRGKLQLKFFAEGEEGWVPLLRQGILAAHGMLRSPVRELSVAIVPARRMARIHERFLDQEGATDVLSFELEHDSQGASVSGEIVICSTVARKRAKSLGHPVEHELLLYAIHGLLHLCGFDDRNAKAFAAMHAREDQILTSLGVGPVFGRDRQVR
jgi:probable rRNA maturation factor